MCVKTRLFFFFIVTFFGGEKMLYFSPRTQQNGFVEYAGRDTRTSDDRFREEFYPLRKADDYSVTTVRLLFVTHLSAHGKQRSKGELQNHILHRG